MKNIIILLSLIFLSSCQNKKVNCLNHFKFQNAHDSIPIVNLDYIQNREDYIQQIKDAFDEDLCQKCEMVDYKIPFLFDGIPGHLKVMADFETPDCGNCPVPVRERLLYFVSINTSDQLLVNSELLEKDSLENNIVNYLNGIGSGNQDSPDRYNKFHFHVYWSKQANPEYVKEILGIISKAHLKFVIQRINKVGDIFCHLTEKELYVWKDWYPLKLELSFGTKSFPPPLPPTNN
ncbi:MAG: hypothetical protein ACPGSD_11400 [Flavobacteriales bacterium]